VSAPPAVSAGMFDATVSMPPFQFAFP
jgi:hypothetical protein